MKATKKLSLGKILLYSIGAAALITGGVFGIKWIKNKRANSDNQEDKYGDAGKSTTGIGAIKIGDMLYPKGTNVNIRETPLVNNSDWKEADFIDNILEANHTSIIGRVVESTVGKNDGLTWYKVELTNPIKGQNYGWVRIDVVKK